MIDMNEPSERTEQTIPIEWDWDMDATTVSLGVIGGQPPFSEFDAAGRCKRCWGVLRGRTGPERAVTGLKCIVCGEILEGSAAAAEAKRISGESFSNALNMMLGRQPKYGDGPFAQKVFPKLHRLSKQELLDRLPAAKALGESSPAVTSPQVHQVCSSSRRELSSTEYPVTPTMRGSRSRTFPITESTPMGRSRSRSMRMP